MFYCDDCRKANGWVKSAVKSLGTCEACGMVETNHDRPSGTLKGYVEAQLPLGGQWHRDYFVHRKAA